LSIVAGADAVCECDVVGSAKKPRAAVLHFSAIELSAGIIAHEAYHAVRHWARLLRCRREETIAYGVQYLVDDVIRQLVARRVNPFPDRLNVTFD